MNIEYTGTFFPFILKGMTCKINIQNVEIKKCQNKKSFTYYRILYEGQKRESSDKLIVSCSEHSDIHTRMYMYIRRNTDTNKNFKKSDFWNKWIFQHDKLKVIFVL